MMQHTFEADGIILRYGLRTILSGIYIKSTTGTITGLTGNNGCGKSSLMKIMFGTLQPESKSLRIDGKHSPYPYLQANAVNYLPQQQFLPPGKTVKRIFRDFNLHLPHFIETFGVEISPYQSAGSLHGSTARLVEIYALLQSPTLFTMLDEPFTHLSPLLVEKLLDYLQIVKQCKGIIITDHNFHYLKSIANELYLLHNGRLKLMGNTSDIEAYSSLFEL